MRVALAVAVLILAACSSPAAPAVTQGPPDPTPAPATAKPWTLEVEDAEYTTETKVGGSVFVKVTVTNTGKKATPAIDINFSDLDANADIRECDPKCQIEDLPGFGPSAVFPGLKAGVTKVYEVEFVATKVGVVAWELCVYDDNLLDGDSVYCGDGRTTIR